jgi:Endonuclease/Exonuclease/phosphatase family
MRRLAVPAALVAALAAVLAGTIVTAPAGAAAPVNAAGGSVRFATYNASLNRSTEGQLVADLSTPANAQAGAVAEVIQRTRPDVLLVNEFDFDAGHVALRLFQDNYLSVSRNGSTPISYPYAYTAPVNTGVPSGFDLNNDGVVGGPDDAYGFGLFPGQFGMAVYSRFPIDEDAIRTFQLFRWADMPGALIPPDWFTPAELAAVRLSSKSHWDVPIEVGRRTVHLLVSHPTPPTFDGPEDRNGRRNHDEIRLWADYITPGRAGYLYDDAGRYGGLKPGSAFVIAGDQNADPVDGDSTAGAIHQLLDHPLVRDPRPASAGAVEQTLLQGGINLTHRGPARLDTADFAEPPGNLRVDYVLPRKSLRVIRSAVFWPTTSDPLFRLVGVFPFPTSDHKLVWVDLRVPGQ